MKLNFNHHTPKICKAASKKLHALDRVSQYIEEDKRSILFNSYFLSQFKHCPLIWISHNKSINKKVNTLHERALRLMLRYNRNSFLPSVI